MQKCKSDSVIDANNISKLTSLSGGKLGAECGRVCDVMPHCSVMGLLTRYTNAVRSFSMSLVQVVVGQPRDVLQSLGGLCIMAHRSLWWSSSGVWATCQKKHSQHLQTVA